MNIQVMNMSHENAQRVVAILERLESFGWVIKYVDDGGEQFNIRGVDSTSRVIGAFLIIDSVEESQVFVERLDGKSGAISNSFISLILSNEEDMLSDYGMLLDMVFDGLEL